MHPLHSLTMLMLLKASKCTVCNSKCHAEGVNHIVVILCFLNIFLDTFYDGCELLLGMTVRCLTADIVLVACIVNFNAADYRSYLLVYLLNIGVASILSAGVQFFAQLCIMTKHRCQIIKERESEIR